MRDSASATSTALLRWIVYWLVLPHLLIILMWPIGGPPMGPLLTLSGLSALLISFIPVKPLQRLLLLCLMIVVTACYVCAMFNISPLDVSICRPFFAKCIRGSRPPI